MAATGHPGDDPDVLEGAPGRPLASRPGSWALGAGAIALVGLLIGYAVGHHRAPTPAPPAPLPTTSATHQAASAPPFVGPPFTQTGATCSVQHGRRLQLGIQIENQTPSIVHITAVRTSEPLHGVRSIASRVGTCGEASRLPVSFDSAAVTSGAATWLTVTLQVLVKCPAPYPVQFAVHYGQANQTRAEKLPGFVDLGNIPYTGCASGQ